MERQPFVRLKDLEESDFVVLYNVVMARESILASGLACKIVCERCKFPIGTASDLVEQTFERPGSNIDLAGHLVTYEDAKQFLTNDLFPITDDRDLASKILFAFDRHARVADAYRTIEAFKALASGKDSHRRWK